MAKVLRIKNENGGWENVPALIGSSAYEIAVENGFKGTEEEWLEMLSPKIEVTETDGGHIVTVTDSRGTRQFVVQDGKKKMSELEQDLQSLVFGNTTIDGNGIIKSESNGNFDLLVYHLRLHGYDVTIDASDGVSIKNLKPPTNDKDAANKKYVDDAKPKKLSELENDSKFITEEDLPDVDVPTKLSELENDLSSFTLGNTTIGKTTSNLDSFLCRVGLQMQAEHMTIRSKQGLNLFSSSATNIQGNVTIKGNVVINDVAYPENNTDAASKEYVDDITGDISTALDTIIAMQSQYMGVSE